MAQIAEIPLDPNDPSNYLGNLPESGTADLVIPDSVPAAAKRWLLYTFVTVERADAVYGRAYYDFTSTEKDKTYHRLMNVAFFKDTVVNSMNVWIPANSSLTLSMKILNNTGDSTHPWRTPCLISNQCDTLFSTLTHA